MALPQKTIECIGEIDRIDHVAAPVADAVHRATRRDAVKNLLSGSRLGHQLHPVLTSLPIGAWAMASALDCLGRDRDADSARRLVALGVLGTVPVAATGAADWSDTFGADRRIGLLHAVLNSAATGLHAGSWAARRAGRSRAGVALSAVGLALTSAAGYLGGHLSYGRGVGVNRTAFQPLISEWTSVGSLDRLVDRTPLLVHADDVPVVLVRVDGVVRALSATCTHAGGSLDQGEVVDRSTGTCIVCPLHGSVFRLDDGRVARGPATVPEPHWQVRVDDGQISIRSAAACSSAE